jgi:cytochrome c peroxidase
MLTALRKPPPKKPQKPANSKIGVAALASLIIGCVIIEAGCEKRNPMGSKGPEDLSQQAEAIEQIPLSVRIYFRPLPEKMPGSENDTPEMVALGKKLYFERRLSFNKTQSCNDCHRLDGLMAGVDYQSTSLGAKGTAGTRNAPTVLNAGFQRMQRWDGRDRDLVEQAKGPLLNPVEMAMPTERDVVERLKNNRTYLRLFKGAFPGQAEPITFDNIALAIASFERMLVTPSRFDRYLKGDMDAITDAEMTGLMRFVDAGCVECHSSFLVGGRLFKKLGQYHPYDNQSDTGRFEVTKNEQDRLVFKVPSLRNVTLTQPYFHDGRVSTLQEAIRMMSRLQLDTELNNVEIDEIVSFLNTLDAESPYR